MRNLKTNSGTFMLLSMLQRDQLICTCDQLISISDQLICTCDQLISTRPAVSSLAAVLSVLTSAAGPAYSSWTLPLKRTLFTATTICIMYTL